MRYKVGDRVIMKEPVDDKFTTVPATVVQPRNPTDSSMMAISFEANPGFGWSTGERPSFEIKGNHRWCWWVYPEQVERPHPQLRLFKEDKDAKV